MIGARRCDRITPILDGLHWLPASQRKVLKTALMVWKCIHGVAPVYFSDLCLYLPPSVCSSELALCIQSNSTGSARPDYSGAAKFRRRRTDHLEQCVACTTSTRVITERFQTCTCLLYTSPSPRDGLLPRMPSSA